MSLLLDALQRASQEKEKLAEARASADKSTQAAEPAPFEPLPPLAVDYAPGAPSLESPSYPESSPAPVTASPASGLAEEAATAPVELTLDPIEPLPASTSPAPGLPDRAQPLATEIPAAFTAPAPEISAAQRREYAPDPPAIRREPTASPASPVAEAKPSGPATPVHPSPAISPQVAREILSATAKASKPAPNRRLMILGVLALLIVVANAAFFLGFLDKFLGTSGSALAPAVPPAPVATPSPAASLPAPEGQGSSESRVLPDGKTDGGDAASSPVATRDTDATPRATSRRNGPPVSAPAAETRVEAGGPRAAKPGPRAAGSKVIAPVFIARPAAVSVLDAAYAALTEGRLDEAAEAYNRALQKNPAERDALLGLAYIAQRQGNREEARSYYQQVLRQEPGHPGAGAGLLSLAAESDLQITASRAREMAERNPDSAVVLSTLGGILAKEGRIGEAQQVYFKALTLEPTNAFHAYNLAVALDRLHKYTQAQGYYQRALTLAEKSGPSDQSGFPRKEALQRLEQLRARDGGDSLPLPVAEPRAR